MARATWKGVVLTESDDYEMVEGNLYFPPQAVRSEHLRPGDRQYTCPWKGKAAYWDVVVGDDVSRNAAWSYPEPSEAARQIKEYVAFGDGITVEP